MSYKFEFFLRIFFMFFNVLTYYFVAKLIGTAGMKYLAPYGGDYFSFVLYRDRLLGVPECLAPGLLRAPT